MKRNIKLKIHKSNKYLYIILINCYNNKIITSYTNLNKEIKILNNKLKLNSIFLLSKKIFKDLLKRKIKIIIFDRNKFKYHGKIKFLSNLLRKFGLIF
ncbi:putative 50S ribosomal subunit protein L18 [Candidatus Zinderia insecticola CARI]|uniref:Putative 50S ribosomal subunit protein L18 n=1 Tax=Zinderia insecticola (strain CARI) TaxID=871271 RepID=E0TJ32_ZINIC|nr:putative 50S ribosomal subunit protein L18 [Candidatus Zinderia insecticola CARI]